jgi:hypothetical protein
MRRKGFSSYSVPMHEDGLTILIARGHLKEGDDCHPIRVGEAIGKLVASVLEVEKLGPSNDSLERVRLDPFRAM